MKITIDTKEDSHEELKKVIKMLQNLVGDSGEVFTNDPSIANNTAEPSAETTPSAMNHIFGATSSDSTNTEAASQSQETSSQSSETTSQASPEAKPGGIDSTGDLFAELFSEKEIAKMKNAEDHKDKDDESKDSNAGVETY